MVSTRHFRYTNCLGDDYPITDSVVHRVTFDVSRYGRYRYTLPFEPAVTVIEAITRVQIFLSQPLVEEYYRQVQDDVFQAPTWEEFARRAPIRADCLGEAIFLEGLELSPAGHLILSCGD